MDANLRDQISQMHARICMALADPNRILILYKLSEGELNVSELTDSLGMTQSTISRHLKTLRERGLVVAQRSGQAVVYHIADRRVIQALDILRAVMTDSLEEQASLAHIAAAIPQTGEGFSG
jgi:DNA-binding transcriptional ArsR family regulator